MTDFDRSMRGTLGSGASRILNVAQTTRRLEVAADAAGGGPPGRLLFGHRGLNRAVFIKRPREIAPPPSSPLSASVEILDGGALRTVALDSHRRVEKGDIATVGYVPYDVDDIAGGGTSFELDGRNRNAALLDVPGLDGPPDTPAMPREGTEWCNTV